MTRAEIRARILHALNESPTAPVFFSASELDEVLDEAAEVLAEDARAIRRTAFLPLIEGTTYYAIRSIAPDVLVPLRLWSVDRTVRLRAGSLADLEARHEAWDTVTGNPEMWFPVSWDCFGLWPRPTTGGNVLRVDYAAWPRPLLDDSDRPEFLDAEHAALVIYGLYYGAAKRWDDATALTAWGEFQRRWARGRGRSGVDRSQARTHQRPMAEQTPGFPSGPRG